LDRNDPLGLIKINGVLVEITNTILFSFSGFFLDLAQG
jgi:hypothetical protein